MSEEAAPTTTRIMDRGYRRYVGERLGIRGAQRSVYRYTLQRVLGIHRLFRFKVVPMLAIGIAYVPMLVYVGIAVISNQVSVPGRLVDGRTLADPLLKYYPEYYGAIIAAIVLWAAFVAPEVLCPDRRTGMLGLYMASPLNRWNYLAAKAGAVLTVMALVTVGPPLVLLIGYSTQGYGPDGFVMWLKTLGRILAAGLAVGGFHTMISLALSSITSRRAAASAAFVVLVLGTGALGLLIVNTDGPLGVTSANLLTLPQEAVFRIFGERHGVACKFVETGTAAGSDPTARRYFGGGPGFVPPPVTQPDGSPTPGVATTVPGVATTSPGAAGGPQFDEPPPDFGGSGNGYFGYNIIERCRVVPTSFVVFGFTGWMVLAFGIVVFNYRRLQVTR